MSLLPPTRELLSYLERNPSVRARIAAPPDATVLYAGEFIRPMWKDLEALNRTNPAFASKQMLPDVLARIVCTGQPHPNLLAWAKALDALTPCKENGFIAWRALSGIFAANAVGSVSFAIGSKVTKDEKVFAATELPVLLRNTKVNPLTRDILAYYQRCVQTGGRAINFGFTSG
ncbi:hypothetical protein [Variovorax rhizosphaerae]|uniref:Uncharacterized protein n=1 Tax=Variovorax rhizosphaerae TaxID=1836200 RepID=A0ABU8WQE6_9BURK